jgi:hypothetical protein
MDTSFRRYSKFKRIVVATTTGLAFMIPLIGVLIATFIRDGHQGLETSAPSIHGSFWGVVSISVSVVLASLFLFFKSYFTYKKLTYDPTWGLKFQEIFDKMIQERHKAAKALREHRDKLSPTGKNRKLLSDVDDVLDFFSDVGFYCEGDQISPEVAYNHFYYWLRHYWVASRDYVSARRAEEEKMWGNLEELFETLCEIEVGRDKEKREQELNLTTEDLNGFLDDEMALFITKGARLKANSK